MSNFADGNDDDFQELLDSLPGLTPIVAGKRGGGRKVTNNIGADVLGVEILNELRKNHHVNLFVPGTLKGNTLWAVVDQRSYDRANQISRGIKPSYGMSGILAISLAQTEVGTAVVQWWKATNINGVLTFSKVLFKGADYRLCTNSQNQLGLWKVNTETGELATKNDGITTIPFPYSTLVNFEEYINAIVVATELSVAFPDGEIQKLRGLSEILASVNSEVGADEEMNFEE